MLDDNNMRLAVLIDAENVPATVIGRVFVDLVRFGEPVIRRALWRLPWSSRRWLGRGPRPARNHARHLPSVGKGKNAADVALMVDAMDLLHGGGLDAFVVVSRDSDLAHLMIRTREEQLKVFAYGNQQTPERLRSACARLVFVENLKFHALSAVANPNMKPLPQARDALPMIVAAIADLASAPGEWVDLDVLERELVRRAADFDARTFGYL